MLEHDPIRFAADLGAKLATRSRHVCIFLGAGASKACGLPDVAELQKRVLSSLSKDDSDALEKQLLAGNLEHVLSRLRRIAALLTGDQRVDGLSGPGAASLDAAICAAIVKELDLTRNGVDLVPVARLAAWVARADYHLPVELFTVNYDLLLETALEQLRVPYYDGFIGTLRAGFQTELVEGTSRGDSVPAFFARLWKLHGSLNWAWEEGKQVVRLGTAVDTNGMAAIYPSDTKYEESRRVPFVVLQDRFRHALHQPETLVLISGYSFSDDHLNEMIFDAATRRERTHIVAFCYSQIPEVLAERARTTPNLQAVTGKEAILSGVRASWVAPTDPPPDLWIDDQLALRSFRHLASYLARSATREPEHDPLIAALLERVTSAGVGTGSQPATSVINGGGQPTSDG